MQNFAGLQQLLIQAGNTENLERLVNEQKKKDEGFKDGGILDMVSSAYTIMYKDGSLERHLDERGRKLMADLGLAKHRMRNDKAAMDRLVSAFA